MRSMIRAAWPQQQRWSNFLQRGTSSTFKCSNFHHDDDDDEDDEDDNDDVNGGDDDFDDGQKIR